MPSRRKELPIRELTLRSAGFPASGLTKIASRLTAVFPSGDACAEWTLGAVGSRVWRSGLLISWLLLLRHVAGMPRDRRDAMTPGSRGWDMAMHRLVSVAHGLGAAVIHCGRAYGRSEAEQYPR